MTPTVGQLLPFADTSKCPLMSTQSIQKDAHNNKAIKKRVAVASAPLPLLNGIKRFRSRKRRKTFPDNKLTGRGLGSPWKTERSGNPNQRAAHLCSTLAVN